MLVDSKRLARLIEILNLLARGRRLTVERLAKRFRVTQRTVQRDLKFLREAGFPVKSTKLRGGEHFFDREVSLQLEMLTDDEKLFMVVTRNALSGLLSSFVAVARDVIGDMEIPEDTVAIGLDYPIVLSDEQKGLLLRLAKAISDRRKVRFSYGDEGESKVYRIDPYKLGYYRGIWYLVGKSKDGVRSFALDRIHSLETLDSRFRKVPDSIKRMRNFRPFFYDEAPVEVVVEVSKEAKGYFERKRFVNTQEKVADLPHGGARFRLMANNLYEVKNMVIKPWLPYVRVVAPSELAGELLREMREWVAEQEALQGGESPEKE